MTDIKNKVAESGLISLDLEKFKPEQEIVGIDVAEQLWQGLALKEKDFRNWIKENDWSAYANKAVYIYCSADAIIPTWAFMLISSRINPFTSRYLVGTKEDVEKSLIVENIQKEDLTPYIDGRVIVKRMLRYSMPRFFNGRTNKTTSTNSKKFNVWRTLQYCSNLQIILGTFSFVEHSD
jgi:hypothetical protein